MESLNKLNSQVSGFLSSIRIRLMEFFDSYILSRYEALTSREQKVVLTAALILPVMIVVFGLLLPLHDRHQQLLKQLAAMTSQALEAEELVSVIHRNGGTYSGDLLSLIEKLARQVGVRGYMTRIRPQPSANGQQLLLEFKDVPYQKALVFLHSLAERKQEFSHLRMQAGSADGLVHLRIVIVAA